MGLRGRDEHYKLMYGYFSIHSTSEGFKYVEFNERDTKHVQVSLIHAANSSPKCGAHLTIPLGALYVFLKLFFIKCPTEMCKSVSPFYLAINYNHSNDDIWYKKQRMGKDRINTIMKRMAETAGLSWGKKLIIQLENPW